MMLKKLKNDRHIVQENIDQNVAVLEQRIEAMINQSLGTEKKVDDSVYKQIAEPVYAANELKMVDPLKIDEKIEFLETYVDNFEAEIDFVLSESNSRTEIEI